MVYPERDMALRLAKRLISASFLDYISLDDSIEIRQIKVSERIVGVSVEELEIRRKYGLNIIALEHNAMTDIEIKPSYQFRSGDVLVVIGKVDNINRFVDNM